MEMQLTQLKLYRLGPLDLMIFNLVALASAQRSIRAGPSEDDTIDDIVSTDEPNGSISRRRIADVRGLRALRQDVRCSALLPRE